MKKLTLVLCLILTVTFLFGCKTEKTPSNTPAGDNGGGSTTAESVSYKIVCSEDYDGAGMMEIFYALGVMDGVEVTLGNDTSAPVEREIVIGRTNREISEAAYKRVPKADEDDENNDTVYSGFAIYSDGKSVAIAYDEDNFDIGAAEASAVKYFIDNYVTGKDTLVLENGVMAKELVDVVAYQRVIDERNREQTYASIRSTVINYTGDSTLAEDIVAAFRDYYALTTPNIVSWLANLYEPAIGGFYYSNSARNTEGFLPDLESSGGAMLIIHYSGLVDHIGGRNGLPEWFKTQLGNFAKSLQDPNGFFYHPQWGKEATDRNQEQRARATGNALSLISLAGMKPTYNIYDTVGDGTLVDGTKVDAQGNVIPTSSEALTERLGGRSIAALVSKVIPAAQTYISPELLTEDAFYAWLDGGCGYNIRTGSYGWGSFVCSRTNEYLQRDKQLAAEGANWRCSDVLIDYLNANRNPENGTWAWGNTSDERYYYDCVNGLLKISGTYTSFGVEMPYALEACQTAIKAIYSDTKPLHICDVYNPWFAVSNILTNLRTCAANAAEGKANADAVRRELLADAPTSIRKTLEKRALFKKDDGSFSYFPTSSASHLTGMPVALKDVNEGDVNATIIAAIDIRDRMCDALGLPKVDILGPADYVKFMSILEELGPVIKDEDTSVLVPITFDEYESGELPNDEVINSTNLRSGGDTKVISDPRLGAEGNVFRFEKKAGKGDILRFPTGDSSLSSACSVFEAEMCFESASVGYDIQLSLDFNYMIGMRFDTERVHFFDTSSQTATRVDSDFEASVAIGEWFKLRVEYYPGDEDTVRIKVYLNDELIAVSDNYYDYYGYKVTNGTGTPATVYEYGEILGMSGSSFVVLLDNVTVGKTRTTYTVTTSKTPLAVDVDAPASEEKVYDFEDSEAADGYPEDFTVSKGSDIVEIRGDEDKELYIKGNKGTTFKIDIPATRVSMTPNSTTVSMDVSFLTCDVGAMIQLGLRQRGSDFLEYAVTGYALKIEEDGDKKYVVMYEYVKDSQGAKVAGVKIPAEQAFKLKIEYYSEERTTLVYIDNALVGLSSAVNGGIEKYRIGELVITSPAKLGYEVSLDNIVVENGEKVFIEATKPTVDRVTHTFDSADGITLGGGASVSGGYASVTNGGYLTVPLNKRSISAGTVVLEALLSVSTSEGDSSIVFTDSEGNALIVYTLKVKGGKVYIHETTEKMTYSEPIASFEAGKTVKLVIEYYIAKDIIQISVDGKCLAVSSLHYNDAAEKGEITAVKLSAESGSVAVDELVIESYNKLYTEYDTSGDNTEDGKENLSFESSTGGNIPSAITPTLGSGGAAVRVDELMKQSERSKVLILTTAAGGADTLTVNALKKSGNYECVALEADISLHFNGSVYLFFRAGGSDIYRINLNMTNGVLHIDDNPGFPPYGTMGNPAVGIVMREWVHLRFELYNKDDGSIAVRVAVNGKFLKESVEPSWTGKVSSITSVNMTTNTGGVGDFMIDDLYFGPTNMTIDTDDLLYPDEGGSGDSGGSGESGGSGSDTDPTEKDVETYEDGVHGITVDGSSKGTVVKEGDNKYYRLDKSVKAEDYLYIPKSAYSPKGADCIVFETKMRIIADTTGPTSVNIIYGRWNGMNKFTLSTDAGSNIIKLSDWRTDAATSLSVADTGVKLGEWFTLRIENYTNKAGETIARVYINGTNVGESTNAGVLGSASANHHLNSLVVKANNNIIGSFDLDDTYFGEDVMISVEEKKPAEDYEDGIHGITVDGSSKGTVVKEGDNKYYRLDKSVKAEDYLYIPKSTYEPNGADCIVFETKMRIIADNTGPTSVNIIYGRWNGMNKFTLSTDAGSNVIKLSDWRTDAATSLSVADTGVKLGEWFTLRIENYTNGAGETIARVYINGTNVGESTNAGVLGSASANHHLNSLVVKANNNIIGSFDLDDTYFGEDVMISVEEKKPTEDFEDGVHGITLDGGSVKTPGTIVTEGDNSYYNKPTDTSDYLYFQKSTYEPDGADCTVFEAKLRINHKGSGPCSFKILYGTWKGMEKFNIYNPTGDDLVIYDSRSGVSSTLNGEIGAKIGEWFTLRIENYLNDQGETVARVYVNGNLVGESTNIGVLGSESENHTLGTVALLLNNNIRGTGTEGDIYGSVDIDDVYLGADKMIVVENDEAEDGESDGGELENGTETEEVTQ